MNCPTCQVALVVADRQGVEIDYCPRCRGIWLDRGELDKLIERATAHYAGHHRVDDDSDDGRRYAPPPQQGGYGPPPHGGYPPRKKEGFFSRMFDFD